MILAASVTASLCPPSAGTKNEWITSLLVSTKRIDRPVGSTSLQPVHHEVLDRVSEQARIGGMTTLLEDGVRKILDGISSIGEV